MCGLVRHDWALREVDFSPEAVVWVLQTGLCPFVSSASQAVGVPSVVAIEILGVQHVFHGFK